MPAYLIAEIEVIDRTGFEDNDRGPRRTLYCQGGRDGDT